jgi:hypothetical protein
MKLWLVQLVAAVTVVGPVQIAAAQGQGQGQGKGQDNRGQVPAKKKD